MALPPKENFYSVTAILERFEDRFAVLRNEGLGEFRWPIANLPQDIKIGESVTLKVVQQKSPNAENEEKLANMRKILEELIN